MSLSYKGKRRPETEKEGKELTDKQKQENPLYELALNGYKHQNNWTPQDHILVG